MLAKLSTALLILALVLLAVSAVPWPAFLEGTAQTAAAPDGPAIATVPPDDTALADRGQALFVVKGCLTCHHHGDVAQSGQIPVGPDLTNYQPDPEFVRRWLRDPAAIRPSTMMPNLELDEAEIDALIAFLSVDEDS